MVECLILEAIMVGVMASRLQEIIVDCSDPRAQARFWCEVLGYVVYDPESEDAAEIVEIGPPPEPAADDRVADLRAAPAVPTISFLRVPEEKSVKNRLHLDLSPVDTNQDAELERILAAGARRVDVGQGDGRSWVVLADPEGNEFCLLRSLAPGSWPM